VRVPPLRQHRRWPPNGEDGLAAPQLLGAAGIATLVLVVLLNLLVWQYGQAAVRDALTVGVQAGRPADATIADCQQAAQQNALANLLSGQ
jgi:hypothetical protein